MNLMKKLDKTLTFLILILWVLEGMGVDEVFDSLKKRREKVEVRENGETENERNRKRERES